MTDQELKDLVTELSRSVVELRKSQQDTDRQIKQTGKQLGELGNRFGSFTEGMAFPSMEKILREEFGMNDISHRHKAIRNGSSLEIDVLAMDNTGERDEIFLVEIKSRLTDDAIKQVQKRIADFPHFFPNLADRKIYGIIAAVDIPDNLRAEALKQGFYLARISEDTFKLKVPRDFTPKAFGPAAETNGHSNGHTKPKKKKTRSK
ncbi:MAG TPA: DUF3782 domain-containing protein [Blastocatellia bacterium]|nr:DUF3782 domain-containing protein [Blastocatellia bacterium]HMV84446.1 DUF3782 domain-containing protein [Blastocatellia bacterium]HMX29217.1 DUF3782 domain-containing protein [Blastocatellia bacterium]HMY74417.1 DUF3782 domain-containing protein [Blastocatellia bacterium]HMZ21247.1 DUF3782 domain-containing protein [Blastocatellia bacterium]